MLRDAAVLAMVSLPVVGARQAPTRLVGISQPELDRGAVQNGHSVAAPVYRDRCGWVSAASHTRLKPDATEADCEPLRIVSHLSVSAALRSASD